MRITGADPGLQARGRGGGAHLKKLRRAKGCAKIFRVFRVKKITILRQKNQFFSNFRARGAPPSGSTPGLPTIVPKTQKFYFNL
jgi:hypothetical protein